MGAVADCDWVGGTRSIGTGKLQGDLRGTSIPTTSVSPATVTESRNATRIASGEELEEKVLEATRSTLFRQDFLEEAVALSASTLNARRPRLEAELN